MVEVRIPERVKQYKITRILGQGSFAVVALGINEQTDEKVAIKIVDRQKMVDLGMIQYLENELRLLPRFNHPSIVKVFDIIYEKDIVMIVMEYLNNFDIQTHLNRHTFFSNKEKMNILYKILTGMEYLHKRGVSHRDIKPDNIIFDCNFEPKLVDFGLCRENGNCLSSFCGTEYFIAPEILKGTVYDGLKSDIWSFGVTAHLLITNEYPWEEMSSHRFMNELKRGTLNIKSQISGILANLINSCLSMNPNERPSASTLVAEFKLMIDTKYQYRNTNSDKILVPKLQGHKNIVTSVSRHSNILNSIPIPQIRVRRINN